MKNFLVLVILKIKRLIITEQMKQVLWIEIKVKELLILLLIIMMYKCIKMEEKQNLEIIIEIIF